jgi:hypothetical protein
MATFDPRAEYAKASARLEEVLVEIKELKGKATSTKEEEAAKVEQLKELKEEKKGLDREKAELLSIIKKDEALGSLFPLTVLRMFLAIEVVF